MIWIGRGVPFAQPLLVLGECGHRSDPAGVLVSPYRVEKVLAGEQAAGNRSSSYSM